jgi:hypothetical protein
MLWNEFIKLNHVSKLSLNEQLRKFNEHIMYEEQVAGSIIQVPVTLTIDPGELGVARLYRNSILVLTQTNAGSKSIILKPGDTFYITFSGSDEVSRYTLRNNAVIVSTDSAFNDLTVTSPTFTATPGSNYEFRCDTFNP